MFKIGLVDLCTSHPQAFVPILRELGCEITAVYDSGQTRGKNFAHQFAKEMDIAHVCTSVEQMVPLVDAAMIHSADWDVHVQRAKPFVKAGKFVCIDKPIVGNITDINKLLDMDKQYPNLIFGGSACVFAQETQRLKSIAQKSDDKIVSALASGPFDMFSYGIHTIEMLQQIVGYDAKSVTCLSEKPLGNYMVHFASGFDAHLHLHTPYQSWFVLLDMFDSGTIFSNIESSTLYDAFLKRFINFCNGKPGDWTLKNSLQPIQTALALQKSVQCPDEPVSLDSITENDCFDGAEFAKKYQDARDDGKALYLIEKERRWGSK